MNELAVTDRKLSSSEIETCLREVTETLPRLVAEWVTFAKKVILIEQYGTNRQRDRLAVVLAPLGQHTVQRLREVAHGVLAPEALHATGVPASVRCMSLAVQTEVFTKNHKVVTGPGKREHVLKDFNSLSQAEKHQLFAPDGQIRSPASQVAYLVAQSKRLPEGPKPKPAWEKIGRKIVVHRPCSLNPTDVVHMAKLMKVTSQ